MTVEAMVDSQAKQAKVLVMDSSMSRARELSHRLRFLNYEPVIADPSSASKQDSNDPGIALVLGDVAESSACKAFRRLAVEQPDLPVLTLGSPNEDKRLSEVLANRPHWTLSNPVRKSQLSQLLRRAERYQGFERRQRISGNSRPIRKVRRLIEQVAGYDTSVLITGESGTGKELVARTIHDLSDRADKPFIPINCGAIPAELIESELFGHKKGAFTGAIKDHVGRFGLAEGGTLFLDEIGDMTLDMQVKLLRVLQEQQYERVGGNQSKKCNVRFISATHRNLPEAITDGKFREDLYYRIGVFPIEMPPLYKRATDLPELLDELLIQHQGRSAGSLRLHQDAINVLANYAWPGNIRELSNLVERLTILYPEGEISAENLPAKYRDPSNRCTSASSEVSNGGTAELGLAGTGLKLYLQDLEIDLIEKAMTEAGGVVAAAARLLNMHRTTLVEKLSKYQLTP